MATQFPVGDERDRSIHGMPGVEDPLRPDDELLDAAEGLEVAENDDGSATVGLAEQEPAGPEDFYANLADKLDEAELTALAHDLRRKIDMDKEARSKRDEQYEEGIRRTGLGNDAPGGAQFTGASKAVHPMLVEGCIDFAASAMRELFPPSGPVKTKIEGVPTKEKYEIASRQQKCLNWLLTEAMPEYVEELEQTMTQLPLGGSQYIKFWWDPRLGRPSCAFVPIDHYYVPYAASSFWTAERRTYAEPLTEFEYDERVESRLYRDLQLSAPALTPDETRAGEAAARVEGKTPPAMNEDGTRIVFEVDCYCKLSVDKEEQGTSASPYLVSLDDQSDRILSIYRNWEPDDKRRRRLDWVTEYGFIFWRGAYKIGLPHAIGGLAAAATGSLRALLDSAHVNNLPTAMILKGTRITGQSKQMGVTELTEIDAGVGVDDIRKAAMAVPFNPPSTVLYQLLGWLTDAGKGVISTAEEKIAEATNNMPVGTTLALIEQGSKVASSIHMRLHRSQQRALRIMSRIIKQHASEFERYQQEEAGEIFAAGADFEHALNVVPVTDPNIYSDAQRYAQNQMLLQMATGGQQQGVQYDLYAIHRRILEQAKIPDIDEVLPKRKGPSELNAAAENVSALLGSPILAFPEQDHLSHLETHLRFALDPFMGAAPGAQPRFLPGMLEHLKQHIAFLYVNEVHSIASDAVGQSIGDMLKTDGVSETEKTEQSTKQGQMVDKVIAAASKLAHASADKSLEALGPVLQQLLQIVQQMQPKPPQDPVEAALAETSRRAQRDQTEMTLKGQKQQTDAQLEAAGLALKDKDIMLDHQVAEERAANEAKRWEAAAREDKAPGNQVAGV